MADDVVAEVIWSSLGCSGRTVASCYSNAGVCQSMFPQDLTVQTYTTMKTAIKTEMKPAQVTHAIFSNFRTLAHAATMSAAMIEK